MENKKFNISTWLYLLLPLVLLGVLVFVFLSSNPVQVSGGEIPPVENLSIQKVTLPEHGIILLDVVNAGPDELKVAQVSVDDAYWEFSMTPRNTLKSLENGEITIYYPWVASEAHEIKLMTSTGATFDTEIEMAVQTPETGTSQLLSYALVGIYVGIIPVGLGLLWYPAMRRFSKRVMGFVLSLTVGLLVFLLVDTFLEVVEVSAVLPDVFQGLPLGLFVALLTWLLIMAVGRSGQYSDRDSAKGRLFVAFLIALGIGFHNLGEGLVVGAAFASGEAALGSFLVVGFILHNITEGIGIAAPVTKERPGLGWFVGMLLIAGGPAILGTLIGGFAYSPLLTVIFLGVGVGAIWQVIVEVGGLLQRDAKRQGESLVSWLNVAGLMTGILVMFLTAFFVKF